MSDILERLMAFPIAEWKEAAAEITRLREELANAGNTKPVETVTYPDGTTATGVPPLPEYSPITADPNAPTLQDTLDALNSEIESLKVALDTANTNANHYAQKVSELEAELAMPKLTEVVSEVAEAPAQEVDISNHPLVLEMRDHITSSARELMSTRAELDSLKESIAAQVNAPSDSTSNTELTTAHAEIESLKAKLAMLLSVSDRTVAEKDHLTSELAFSNLKVADLSDKLAVAEEATATALSKVATLEKHIVELSANTKGSQGFSFFGRK